MAFTDRNSSDPISPDSPLESDGKMLDIEKIGRKIPIKFGGIQRDQMDFLEEGNLRVYQCFQVTNLFDMRQYFRFLESRIPNIPEMQIHKSTPAL
jgi:hypothetical protein